MLTSIPSSAFERQRTRRFFNLVSPIYPFIEKGLMSEYQRIVEDLSFDPGLSVLDLATGTGILGGSFANRGHKVTGLDFSENLLHRAKNKYPQVCFHNSDLANLNELSADSFDLVTMGFLLMA